MRRDEGDDEVRVPALVFHHEDAPCVCVDGDVGQAHVECRPLPLAAHELDRSVVELDKTLRQREAETRAGCGESALVETLERSKDTVLLIQRDSDTGVGDYEVHGATAKGREEGDAAAGRRELDGIRQEVEEHLPDAARVDMKGPVVAIACGGELDILNARRLPSGGEHRCEKRLQHDRFRPELEAARLYLRKIQHVVDQREEMASGIPNIAEIAPLTVVYCRADLFLQELRESDDRVERRP